MNLGSTKNNINCSSKVFVVMGVDILMFYFYSYKNPCNSLNDVDNFLNNDITCCATILYTLIKAKTFMVSWQVRDEYRTDYDSGRGGYGIIMQSKFTTNKSATYRPST